MNALLPAQIALPSAPLKPDNVGMSPELRKWVDGLTTFLTDSNRMLGQALTQANQQINTSTQGVGDDLASADTIAPFQPIHVVTGTAAISTIAVPQGFSGPVWLLVGGAWTLVAQVTNPDGSTTGNIAKATTAIQNTVLMVVFNPRTGLWYPSYS